MAVFINTAACVRGVQPMPLYPYVATLDKTTDIHPLKLTYFRRTSFMTGDIVNNERNKGKENICTNDIYYKFSFTICWIRDEEF